MWQDLLTIVVSSGLVIGLVEWIRFHRKDKADVRGVEADTDSKISDNAMRYAEKIEERLSKMEEKVDLMEGKMLIYQQAINCAYRCGNVLNPEQECPVIIHLNDNGNNKQ